MTGSLHPTDPAHHPAHLADPGDLADPARPPDPIEPLERGPGRTRGSTHLLSFLVRLPRPMEVVWPRLATPEGLAGWFTTADELQPRLGGAVALGGLGSGHITAWDVDRVAEYTVSGGRLRFHLERDGDTASVLRFTHEFRGEDGAEQAWRTRFERLIENLEAAA